jgi:hypothetical protein
MNTSPWDGLRDLAEKATPGPWRWGSWNTEYGSMEADEDRRDLEAGFDAEYPTTRRRGEAGTRVLTADDPVVWWDNPADAEFIAACDPQTILALIDDRDRLRNALRAMAGLS